MGGVEDSYELNPARLVEVATLALDVGLSKKMLIGRRIPPIENVCASLKLSAKDTNRCLGRLRTITVPEPEMLPSVAITVSVPVRNAVKRPSAVIVPKVGSLTDQLTGSCMILPAVSIRVAVNPCVAPTVSVVEEGETVMSARLGIEGVVDVVELVEPVEPDGADVSKATP